MKIRFYSTILLFILAVFTFASCSGSDSGGSGTAAPVPSPTVSASPSPTPSASASPSPVVSPTPSSTPSAVVYPTPQPELQRKNVTIGSTTISAEIANDDKSRQDGLSWRTSLGKNDGMLFVFDEKGIYTMWMYGMRFPLDVLWINDNKVVYIRENVPNPSNPLSTNIPSYTPDSEANYFLEVSAGFVKTHGIKVGDTFKVE
ncbi:MAG: DUF192 domain-containing protein [Firmicutes bacterium]|nr:DUF192 domain-containing protein [Bacillota bacterium]